MLTRLPWIDPLVSIAITLVIVAGTWDLFRESEAKWMLHGIAAFAVGLLVTGFFEHNLADSEILMLALGLITIGGQMARDGILYPHRV